MLIGSIFLLKGNFAEAEGLVIGDEIEYSFNEHLDCEGAKDRREELVFYLLSDRDAFSAWGNIPQKKNCYNEWG